jgi:hypothetical protein
MSNVVFVRLYALNCEPADKITAWLPIGITVQMQAVAIYDCLGTITADQAR